MTDEVTITIERRKLIIVTENHGGYMAGRCIMCGTSGWIENLEHKPECALAKARPIEHWHDQLG